MMTLRQIERLWQGKSYGQISRLMLEMRPEASVRLGLELAKAVPAAAMAVVRLDELSQGYTPFCGQLIRTILAAQEADGGWGELITTALCLRALGCASGEGAAIDAGLHYLANLQKADGLWPNVPLRRMPSDVYVSAFILYQLGDDPRFAQAVRLDDAIGWFEKHENELDEDARRLWQSISIRHGVARSAHGAMAVWS
jgi:hypothetical protein